MVAVQTVAFPRLLALLGSRAGEAPVGALPPLDPPWGHNEHGAADLMSAGLTVQVVRWVDDEPQPGWVEATFTDAHGETWHFFDKPPVFEAPGSPVLTREQSYPVAVVLPVEVLEERASDVGRVAIIRLPWGLDYELAKDTFEVAASDLVR